MQQGGRQGAVALDHVRHRIRIPSLAEQVAELDGVHGDGDVGRPRRARARRQGPVAAARTDQHQAGAAGRVARAEQPHGGGQQADAEPGDQGDLPRIGRGKGLAKDRAQVVAVDPGLEQPLDKGDPQRLARQARVGQAHRP
ncbi:MAG TPA: hypothetical protein VGR68_03965, partial [Actinomycetota bacterium]|nr:hypothetical protein [Actinomycetota bacterium]